VHSRNRISVELILELISSGATADDIVLAYPQLTRDDVSSALRFAATFLRDTTLAEAIPS
jgi:uncharacterized protein (DUF433 family)